MTYKFGNYTIESDISYGIYKMGANSGTGKSYMFDIFSKIGPLGLKCGGYTYGDYVRGLDPECVLNPPKEVVIFDRYDLYSNIFGDKLQKYRNETLILVDSKSCDDDEDLIYDGVCSFMVISPFMARIRI